MCLAEESIAAVLHWVSEGQVARMFEIVLWQDFHSTKEFQ